MHFMAQSPGLWLVQFETLGLSGNLKRRWRNFASIRPPLVPQPHWHCETERGQSMRLYVRSTEYQRVPGAQAHAKFRRATDLYYQ